VLRDNASNVPVLAAMEGTAKANEARDFRYWHFAGITELAADFRFQGRSGRRIEFLTCPLVTDCVEKL
jgi:hypothetical protein